jgi:hypothetical protein
LIFTIILANNISINTPLKCSASLQCVGRSEGKSPKVILQYSYTFEQIHQHTAKYKDYKTVHEDNYVFFFLKLQTAGKKKWGKFKYYIWYAVLGGKLKHDDLCDIWLCVLRDFWLQY